MSNVRSIARAAGVSITTVSRVLNNHPQVSPDVRRRVLAASNSAGYVPPTGRRSTSNIALLYTGDPSLSSPFDAAVVSGLYEGLQERGYDLLVLDAQRGRLAAESYTQMFMRKGVRGVILRTTAQTREVCQDIASEGFPAVVAGDRFDHPKVSYLYSDSRLSSREAIEHLLAQGHRRIAICVNVVDDSDHTDRLTAYRDALAAHGIAFDERLVLRLPANRQGGQQALRRLMAMPARPTAAFLTDPMVAIGAVAEAGKQNVRIPHDLSIVGFDDGEARYAVCPELSSVCQNARSLGRAAIDALVRLMEGVGDAPIRISMPTWFEIHASSGPPPADRQ